ncbi:MAG: tRNA uridine-5-carboxymethylaminomethyl(34) synthesis GTPase MnmE [Firmicutes bacterium]|nr:tRNA uridine-5-carboxymethylaminomethyl(34) synthesis GTPase MnmE [Bacillota bacterium]
MNETIAAVATAYGEGGIGIIRISGDRAGEILAKVFVPGKAENDGCADGCGEKCSGAAAFETALAGRRLAYGTVRSMESGNVLDEAMAVFMKGPKTYTGEDVAEIQCHGSVISLRQVLDEVLAAGARLAEPGEFTRRAFLSGRLDLSQAEAVIDLIRSESDKGHEAALKQLSGSVSLEMKKLREALMEQLILLAVNMDYPDEDIELATLENLKAGLVPVKEQIDSLIASAEQGKIYREGIAAAIAGRPNVGKSSLLNALLKEERAIVTDIPGTTRDTIEERVSIGGFPLRLTDTAGIRDTENVIERIGIERSHQALAEADVIFLLVDGHEPFTEQDRELAKSLDASKTLLLINKGDLQQVVTREEAEDLLPGAQIVQLSAKERQGITDLEDLIVERIFGGKMKQGSSTVITSLRQKDALRRSGEALQDALDAVDRAETLELIEVDVRRCWELLGEISGETASEDIIDRVFERFCLGK